MRKVSSLDKESVLRLARLSTHFLSLDDVEQQLVAFVEWSAQAIEDHRYQSKPSQTHRMLLDTLPAALQALDLLRTFKSPTPRLVQRSPSVHSPVKRDVDPSEQIREAWLSLLPEPRDEEERRLRKSLSYGIARAYERLKRQLARSPYRSSEQYIYTLADPRTQEVRYVGWSHEPRRRLRRHMKYLEGRQEMRDWLGDLHQHGLWPVLEIVDGGEVASRHAEEREFRWILHYLRQGARLTNVEASYAHLVQACRTVEIESFISEPLDLDAPTPAWWRILEAYAEDLYELAERRRNRAS